MIQTATITSPTALATDVTVGPLAIRVDQAIIAEGNATVASTSDQTDEAPEGLSYVLAQVTVVNNGEQRVPLAAGDFPFTGTDAVLRRCPSMKLPDPPFNAAIAPGESFTGWTAGLVNDTSSVVMLIDPAIQQGPRFSGVFALTEGASLPAPSETEEINAIGADISSPATLGDTIQTTSWSLQVTEAIDVDTYFELSDYRVGALGNPNGTGWGDLGSAIGVSVTIRNRTTQPRFFSWTALQLVDTNGEAWDHLLAMTQPRPPASVELLPGGTWTGWYGILLQPWATNRLLRFRASGLDHDPRYISLDGSSGEGTQASNTSEQSSDSNQALDLAPGDLVQVGNDPLNLRDDASVDGNIVTELDPGTQLSITGDVVEAGSYRWYPVEVVDTGESGFIAEDFITPVED